MNVEELREYCLSLPKAKENTPFSKLEYDELVTYTVGGKWFCLLDLESKRVNVKCDPDVCLDMRDKYRGAFPAWHLNKKHWLYNTAAISDRFGTQDKTNNNVIRTWATTQEKSIQRSSRPK